ncbi:MAG TPA: hypothetical protein DCE71_07930 [Parachlamydiales bacterium]|nr:hypothetical protein [Parachlamydiales bacterium]
MRKDLELAIKYTIEKMMNDRDMDFSPVKVSVNDSDEVTLKMNARTFFDILSKKNCVEVYDQNIHGDAYYRVIEDAQHCFAINSGKASGIVIEDVGDRFGFHVFIPIEFCMEETQKELKQWARDYRESLT